MATATKNAEVPTVPPDTSCQVVELGSVAVVHVIPSTEYAAWADPLLTATNAPLK